MIGWAMSRATGLWVGMKALADTMDSSAAVDLFGAAPRIIRPGDGPTDVSVRWPDSPLEQERRLFEVRLPPAITFGRVHGLNHSLADPGDTPRPLRNLAARTS